MLNGIRSKCEDGSVFLNNIINSTHRLKDKAISMMTSFFSGQTKRFFNWLLSFTIVEKLIFVKQGG